MEDVCGYMEKYIYIKEEEKFLYYLLFILYTFSDLFDYSILLFIIYYYHYYYI